MSVLSSCSCPSPWFSSSSSMASACRTADVPTRRCLAAEDENGLSCFRTILVGAGEGLIHIVPSARVVPREEEEEVRCCSRKRAALALVEVGRGCSRVLFGCPYSKKTG